MWANSSAGRALAWHVRGRRFDPDLVHQSFSFSTESSENPNFTHAVFASKRELHKDPKDKLRPHDSDNHKLFCLTKILVLE